MKIQLYLSGEVQAHFSISPQDLQSDAKTPLSSDWRSLWRCDHLISTDDGLEHLFIFTNAVTHFSLIMVDRASDFQSMLGSFQQHFALALHEHGQDFENQQIEIDCQLLTDTPGPMNLRMQLIADLSIECLLANDANIDITEEWVNNYESLSYPTSASDAMRKRITPDSNILPFRRAK
ncbi:hypothetical protein ACFPK9_05915 [Rubritalea spongiae]|uniref:Uncharacterized protein n=1 Tax=Rubritalea spongiae TaxID=430797 RepID=A0ABW5E4G4_9BACT